MNKTNKNKNNKKKSRGGPIAAAYTVVNTPFSKGARAEVGKDVVVSEVAGSVNFAAIDYAINPGLEHIFGSLSKEAARFDRYEIISLEFHFIGTTVISTTTGQIGLAFDPNANSDAPTTQAEFSAYECSIISSVYRPDGLILRVPQSMLRGMRFIRNGQVGSDLSLYDPGRLVVMTRNEAGTTAIGYVEAQYRVRFHNYHLRPGLALSQRCIQFFKSSAQTYVTTVGANFVFDSVDGSPSLYNTLSAGVVTLYPGNYWIFCTIFAQDDANESFQVSAAITKNGASYSGGQQSIVTGGAGGHALTVQAILSGEAEMTVALWLTMTGAAGTLTATGGRYTIMNVLAV
jgi:hypothetical protein